MRILNKYDIQRICNIIGCIVTNDDEGLVYWDIGVRPSFENGRWVNYGGSGDAYSLNIKASLNTNYSEQIWRPE